MKIILSNDYEALAEKEYQVLVSKLQDPSLPPEQKKPIEDAISYCTKNGLGKREIVDLANNPQRMWYYEESRKARESRDSNFELGRWKR